MRDHKTAREQAHTTPNAWLKPAVAIALLGVLVIAAGVAFRLGHDGKRPEARATTERAATRQPSQRDPHEFEALSKELELVRARMRGLEERVSSLPEPPVADPASADLEPAVALALDGATIQARYDEILRDQTADSAWARSEERAIADFVNGSQVSGTKLETVECRSTLCRVRLHIENERASAAFRDRIGEPPLDKGGFLHIDEASGTMTFFSPRAGHQLPSAEPG